MNDREIEACLLAIVHRNKDNPEAMAAEFKDFQTGMDRAARIEFKALFGRELDAEALGLSDLSVVVFGNPFDGLTLYGPFEEGDDAVRFAEDNAHESDWWIIDLLAPASLDAAGEDGDSGESESL
jgi:hypothetical protein